MTSWWQSTTTAEARPVTADDIRRAALIPWSHWLRVGDPIHVLGPLLDGKMDRHPAVIAGPPEPSDNPNVPFWIKVRLDNDPDRERRVSSNVLRLPNSDQPLAGRPLGPDCAHDLIIRGDEVMCAYCGATGTVHHVIHTERPT